MSDSTTFKRAITAYANGTTVVHQDEVRAAADPIVTANPQYWVALSDADLSGGTKKVHAS